MSPYHYEDDDELAEALGRQIMLKRLADVVSGEDYVLHASYWWEVVREDWTTGVLYLEIAGPSSPDDPETAVLVRDEGDLLVTAAVASELQFQDGVLLDVPWPRCGLIYVKDARMRGTGGVPDERVFGIFALRSDPDGSPYYAPVDQEMQPGVASTWLLDPRFDVILSWEPVDVADLLREYSEESRD